MKRLLAAAALVAAAGVPLGAQVRCIMGTKGCYDVDLVTMSAAVGYATQSVGGLQGGVPDREMGGAYLYYDVKLLALLLRNAPVRVYDAAHIGIAVGSMSTPPLSDGFLGDEEASSFSWDFGYEVLAGKKVGPVTVLGGLAWRSYSSHVGETLFDGTSQNLAARVEWGSRKPIVAMAYLPFGGRNSMGARIDIPFFRNLNITAAALKQDGKADSPWLPSPMDAKSTTLLLGFRSRELR